MKTFLEFLIEDLKSKSLPFQYHDKLNAVLWDDDKLKPEIRKQLLVISKEFQEFLDSPSIDIQDVIITGSLTNYNYNKSSDIDLHLIAANVTSDGKVCKFSLAEFLRTKKILWNDQHNITVKGFPVELYVQLSDEKLVASGVYSLLHDKWVKHPTHDPKNADFNEYAIKVKAAKIAIEVDQMIDDRVDDVTTIDQLIDRIKQLRKIGLDKGGEFSIENLSFKFLRSEGYIDKLYQYKTNMQDSTLSIK